MEIIVVDSSVWVNYFDNTSNPKTEWLDRAIGRELIVMPDLNLCEVLQGIRAEPQYEEIKLQLLEFEVFPTGGLEMAVAAAENHRSLRATDSPSERRLIAGSLRFVSGINAGCCIETAISIRSKENSGCGWFIRKDLTFSFVDGSAPVRAGPRRRKSRQNFRISRAT